MLTGTKSLFHVLFAMLVACLFGGGCAHIPPPDHTVKVAFLDARMAEETSTDSHVKAGWWMGTRDRFDSGSVGPYVAESAVRQFSKIPGVEVFSPTDLHAFLAQKERMIRRAYPDLSPEERLRLLREQSPSDFGRSLNVDYVVSGEVHVARTIHNRTFHWWRSEVSLTLEVWDVSTGKVAWSWSGDDTSMFHSTVDIIDDLAKDAAHRADKEDAFKFYLPRVSSESDALLRRGD